MLPGWFFFGWASWWLLGVFRLHMRSSSREPYVARAWYDFPWCCCTKVPLEPLLKVLLTFIGINGELWFGHESWRCAAFVLSSPCCLPSPCMQSLRALPWPACRSSML